MGAKGVLDSAGRHPSQARGQRAPGVRGHGTGSRASVTAKTMTP